MDSNNSPPGTTARTLCLGPIELRVYNIRYAGIRPSDAANFLSAGRPIAVAGRMRPDNKKIPVLRVP